METRTSVRSEVSKLQVLDGGDLEGDVGKVVLEFEFKLRVSLCW